MHTRVSYGNVHEHSNSNVGSVANIKVYRGAIYESVTISSKSIGIVLGTKYDIVPFFLKIGLYL